MGCFNHTCLFSGLPITAKDAVMVFLLHRQPEERHRSINGSFMYADDLWKPVGPPITGFYDEYGGITSVRNDQAARELLRYLQEHEQVRDLDLNAIRDWDFPQADQYAYVFVLEAFYIWATRDVEDLLALPMKTPWEEALLRYDVFKEQMDLYSKSFAPTQTSGQVPHWYEHAALANHIVSYAMDRMQQEV